MIYFSYLPGVAPLPISSSPRAIRTGPIKTGSRLQVLDHSRWTEPMRTVDELLIQHHVSKDLLKRVDADYAALLLVNVNVVCTRYFGMPYPQHWCGVWVTSLSATHLSLSTSSKADCWNSHWNKTKFDACWRKTRYVTERNSKILVMLRLHMEWMCGCSATRFNITIQILFWRPNFTFCFCVAFTAFVNFLQTSSLNNLNNF